MHFADLEKRCPGQFLWRPCILGAAKALEYQQRQAYSPSSPFLFKEAAVNREEENCQLTHGSLGMSFGERDN